MSKKRTVIVVDDDENQAHLLEDFLTSKDYVVGLAFTGETGLQKIIDIRPDLIILDMVLPDMNGSEVCSQLRAGSATKHIPIILCSAREFSPADKVRGFRSGADDYLVRPFDLSELLARMEAIFRRANVQPRAETLAGIHAFLEKPAAPATTPLKPPAAETKRTPLPSVPVNRTAFHPPSKIETTRMRVTKTPNIFRKFWDILNHPRQTLKNIDETEDFLVAILLVLGTPVLASLSKLFDSAGGFDSWIGIFSLGLVVQLVMWFATAGVLHMTLPFHGIHLPMKKALTVAGFCWAPRLLGAVIALVYVFLAGIGLGGGTANFSSGIDILPGMPFSSAVSFVSHFGIFEIWSAFLAVMSVWIIGETGRRWNTVSILVGLACLVFGALSSF